MEASKSKGETGGDQRLLGRLYLLLFSISFFYVFMCVYMCACVCAHTYVCLDEYVDTGTHTCV